MSNAQEETPSAGKHMSRREWTGTLLSAGMIIAVAALVDSHPSGDAKTLTLIFAGAFGLAFVLGLINRKFSGKSSARSIRLKMEVHP